MIPEHPINSAVCNKVARSGQTIRARLLPSPHPCLVRCWVFFRHIQRDIYSRGSLIPRGTAASRVRHVIPQDDNEEQHTDKEGDDRSLVSPSPHSGDHKVLANFAYDPEDVKDPPLSFSGRVCPVF